MPKADQSQNQPTMSECKAWQIWSEIVPKAQRTHGIDSRTWVISPVKKNEIDKIADFAPDLKSAQGLVVGETKTHRSDEGYLGLYKDIRSERPVLTISPAALCMFEKFSE